MRHRVRLKYRIWTGIILLVYGIEFGYFVWTGDFLQFHPRQMSVYFLTAYVWALFMLLLSLQPDHPSPAKYFGHPADRWSYTGGHLTLEDRERYARGVMDEQEKTFVWEHVVRCTSCHDRLIEIDEPTIHHH